MSETTVQIPDDLEAFVARSVEAGNFKGAGELVVNLLYSYKAQSEVELPDEQQAAMDVLRTEIRKGIDQADRGDFVEFTAEDIIAEGRVVS